MYIRIFILTYFIILYHYSTQIDINNIMSTSEVTILKSIIDKYYLKNKYPEIFEYE